MKSVWKQIYLLHPSSINCDMQSVPVLSNEVRVVKNLHVKVRFSFKKIANFFIHGFTRALKQKVAINFDTSQYALVDELVNLDEEMREYESVYIAERLSGYEMVATDIGVFTQPMKVDDCRYYCTDSNFTNLQYLGSPNHFYANYI